MSHSFTLPLAHDLSDLLRTQRFGRTLRSYQTVDSTNMVAMQWAAEGAPEGSVVLADYQTAGRGRQGRTWQATAGQNLTFSVILRPALPPARLSLITLASSVAIAETVEAFTTPLKTTIKWPNDVLLEGYKCCGTLLESAIDGTHRTTVILGIGLNVNQHAFPPDLEHRATSLLLQTGRSIPRAPLLAALLQRLEQAYDDLFHGNDNAICAAYEAQLHGLGQPTTLRFAGHHHHVTGVLLGITDTGALRLQTNNTVRTFHAGEVTSSRF